MKPYLLILPVLLLLACRDHTVKQASVTTDTPAPQSAGSHTDTACTVQAQHAPADTQVSKGDYTIEPGRRIGKVYLGMDAAELYQVLGKPDESDAAMGKTWLTWYGRQLDSNRTELNIYTAYEDSTMRRKTVQQIRTTSSAFTTPDGIGVYDNSREIYKIHSRNSGMGSYHLPDHRRVILSDDIRRGIGFEIVNDGGQQVCIGIIVHPAGKTMRDVYITLHPELDSR